MAKLIALTILISSVLLSSVLAQDCDPDIVSFHPHQYSCERFILCYHGNPLEYSCAPGLHFSPSISKCDFPEKARCDVNYMCPPEDDPRNPIFLPNRFDCSRYYVCFRGDPLPVACGDNLWWDIEFDWCTTADNVTCDDRTPNNPNIPTTPTELPTELPTAPPISTENPREPDLSDCFSIDHLFDTDTGAYIKSSCIIDQGANYEQAEIIAREHNMELFTINDAMVEKTFFNATMSSLSAQTPGGFIWINGRRSGEEWHTFNPDRASLFPGIDWVRTESIDGRIHGDCLRYTAVHNPFYQAMGDDCDFPPSWFACEFHSPPVLNTEICNNNIPLVDEQGAHLKSSCIVWNAFNYWEAEQSCRDNGMNLFVINNSSVQAALLETTTEVISGIYLWINGRRENDEWFVFGPRRTPIYEGLEWMMGDGIDGRTSGDCLMYSAELGRFLPRGLDCPARAWFICEY